MVIFSCTYFEFVYPIATIFEILNKCICRVSSSVAVQIANTDPGEDDSKV